jgi:hypothetical protein
LIDLDHGLYKWINVHKVSTLSSKINIVKHSSPWISHNSHSCL